MAMRRGSRWLGLAALVLISVRSEAGAVRGTILDRAGQPASGAKVWVAKLGYMEPLQVHEASANDVGAFSVEAGPGDWCVFARKGNEGGRAGWHSLANVEEGKDPKPVNVRLTSPSNLRGRLLDAETGQPVSKGRFALDDARVIEIDAQGRFEAPGLEMTHHEAYPLCPGYERKRILFDTTGRPDCELELRLPKGGKVVGKVIDQGGKPVAGAMVGLRTSGSIFSGSALWEKCSADGSYSYDGKPLGRTGRLAALASGYQDNEREDVVVTDPSKATEIDFTLRPDPRKPNAPKPVVKPTDRRAVSGTVLGPDGKPVADAVVRWGLLVSSDSVPETKTDAKGAFRLEAVPNVAEVLSVMAKGLAPSFPSIDAGGDRQLVVDLSVGLRIQGQIIDDAGKPIEVARVVPQVPNPKPNWGGFVYLHELEATSDRDGKFTLDGIPVGATCDVVAENYSAVRQRPLVPLDESKNVVTLQGEGGLRGRVVDPNGNPVKNFRVQVGIPRGNKQGDPAGGYFAGYSGTGLSFTRPDGEFTITGLTAGHLHLLTVIADSFGVGEFDRVEARSVSRLKPSDTVTITLGLPHIMRVRVFQAGGKPVEGARVTVIQSEGQGMFQWGYNDSSWDDSVTARVNSEGWAEFPALSFGKGTVIVRAAGFSRRRVSWLNKEQELEVDLEPESRVNGRIVDEAGKPVSGAKVTLSWGTGEMTTIPVDGNDGGYVADGLGSGKFNVNVISSLGQSLYTGAIELESGKTLTNDIQVKTPKPKPAPAG